MHASDLSRAAGPTARRRQVVCQSGDKPNSSDPDAEREQRLATLEKRGRRRDLMPQPTRAAQKAEVSFLKDLQLPCWAFIEHLRL